jgi:tetratricopeptide (TPR) repeat protein
MLTERNAYWKSLFALILSLAGCDYGDKPMTYFLPEKADWDVAFQRLEFKCTHEEDRLPPLDPDAHRLYQYGLHLSQISGPKDFDEAARYYRIAAAHDHYRAATNLQALLSQGLTNAPRPQKETINLAEHLINRGIPGAYYDMGHYLELGYGVKQDADAARYYFRRAADFGNPEAQYYVAALLAKTGKAGGVPLAMMRCSMEQGHPEAAIRYGVSRKNEGLFIEALEAYQSAAKFGNPAGARRLREAFNFSKPSNETYYLAADMDNERSRRYSLMMIFLNKYENLGAKVPDIDLIVPLPPAKLPDWDETFEWKRKRDAALPLSPPSEELIARMCDEKGLDPATGWPLSGLR